MTKMHFKLCFIFQQINGEKRLLPVTVQLGFVKIYQSGMFAVTDIGLGMQIKYDYHHIATVLLLNTTAVSGLCGNNNGIEDDDLRTPQGDTVDATTFGWSWRVPHLGAQCTADCGDACVHCSAEQLQETNVIDHLISLHRYILSPQSPFYPCHDVVSYARFSSAVNIFDLCSSSDTQRDVCLVLEAYAAACQNALIQIGEWRNSTLCRK